jgi:ssDNA-binding Zn-finger/Zn-ribbon topoisomerase 1
MPRQRIGEPNHLGAVCPECGATLVLHAKSRKHGRLWICPAATQESVRWRQGAWQMLIRKAGAVHESAWTWTDDDLALLIAGSEETTWHKHRRYLADLDARGAARLAAQGRDIDGRLIRQAS